MTIRERILATLYWNEPDQVPLTVYEVILKRGMRERLLRNLGVGLIYRPAPYQVEYRNVEVSRKEYWEHGKRLIRHTLTTPVGEIWETLEPDVTGYDTNTWIKEHFLKQAEDYRVMEYVWGNMAFHDNSARILELIRQVGDDGLVYSRVAKSPIQEMLYLMLGLEQFSLDYYDHLDLIDSLHDVMLRRYEEIFSFAASAPVEILLLGDNITSDVVGKNRFRKYLKPVYRKLHGMLQGTDKKLAVHMDGNLQTLKEEIGSSAFDILEALTPPPMCDVSIREARQLWPDKALWINFTSSMHIEKPHVIEQHTRNLLEEAGHTRGFAISVTEDAPPAALEKSLEVIANVLAAL